MKRDGWIFLLMIAMVVFMAVSVKTGSAGLVAEKAAAALSSPLPAMHGEIPLLLDAKDSKNVFSMIYEEDEDTDAEIKLEIENSHISPLTPKGKAKVLVYHTHITEAYAQTDAYKYQESGGFRTAERDKSVAKVGEELCKQLESSGVTAVHDTSDFEPPKLGTAYTRSLQMLEKRKSEEYDIYLDIHRDAYDPIAEDTLVHNGVPMAKVMMVIGTGAGNNGTPILPLPDYKSNYAYAKKVTDNINSQVKGLAKDVRVNKSRYNQHISKRAILIEMGYTGNNLDQVLASVPYVAKAVADTIQK